MALEQDLERVVTDGLSGPLGIKSLDSQTAAFTRAAAELLALLRNYEPIDAAEFKKRRRASGYTQETFAELLHVHRYTVSRWETGEVQVPLYVVPILDVLKST